VCVRVSSGEKAPTPVTALSRARQHVCVCVFVCVCLCIQDEQIIGHVRIYACMHTYGAGGGERGQMRVPSSLHRL